MTTLAAWLSQLAQQVPVDAITPLAPLGLLGSVLAWFMHHGAKLPAEIRALAHRIDGLTRALLVDMVEKETCGEKTKNYCREEIAKIEARQNTGK